MATLEALLISEMDRISQRLAQRIKQLAKRYQTTLPGIESDVDELTQKVNGHLKKMGFSW
jgi:type I restriction enzyme M protein